MENLEKVLVSRGERIVLQMLDKKYKYLARDLVGDLYVYTDGDCCGLEAFNHHFQFIQWSDEEPWLITDIINKCGVKFD